jgi:hypothetical protein
MIVNICMIVIGLITTNVREVNIFEHMYTRIGRKISLHGLEFCDLGTYIDCEYFSRIRGGTTDIPFQRRSKLLAARHLKTVAVQKEL